MFTPASNGIPASDKYVSSTPVVLDAGLNDQLRNTQIRKLDGQKRRKPKKMSHFPEIKNRHDDLVASLEYARVNKSIIYATTQGCSTGGPEAGRGPSPNFLRPPRDFASLEFFCTGFSA